VSLVVLGILGPTGFGDLFDGGIVEFLSFRRQVVEEALEREMDRFHLLVEPSNGNCRLQR